MREEAAWVLAPLALLLPLALATHDSGCVYTSADPSTVNVFDTPLFGRLYDEERDNPVGTQPPVPGSGFLLGGGTWLRQESNGLPGMQRGYCQSSELPSPTAPLAAAGARDDCLTGSCFPPSPLPCLIIDSDPIIDETCTHGGDRLIF